MTLPRSLRESSKPFINAVGGHFWSEFVVLASGDHGVRSMDRRFMEEPTNPPPSRAGTVKGGHNLIWATDARHSVEEHHWTGEQPLSAAIRIVWRTTIGHASGVQTDICSLTDDFGGPQVGAANVAHELTHGPPRAGGNGPLKLNGEHSLSE
jgi:hypothetical protein